MSNQNKQYTDLVNDAYKRYADSHTSPPSNPGGSLLSDNLISVRPMEHSEESFINKIKTDDEFANKWGVKVEIRELKHKERIKLAWSVFFPDRKNESVPDWWNVKGLSMDEKNIPTRAISLTYNNQTIEIYES